MDAFRSKHNLKQRALGFIDNCINKTSYTCLHIHIRNINNEELNTVFKTVLNINNHKLSMKFINSIYNYKSKNELMGLYLENLIKSFLDDARSAEKIKNCKEVISLCTVDLLKAVAKNIIKYISLEQLKLLIKILCINFIDLKDITIYGNLDIIKFITNKIYGNYIYKDNIIINFIIDMLNNNDIIDFNKLKWIIDNYKDCLNINLLNIISGVKKFSENNNSYIIIDYLLYLMNITHQEIYKIFKKIIYNGNDILFSYMSIKYFSRIQNFNYFEYACLFSNPNSDFNNNLIGLAYVKTQLSVEKLDDIFNKSCKYKIISAIKWFTTFLPDRYIFNQNNPCINTKGNIIPIISPFYMDKRCKFIQQKDTSECCVCFENKSSMIILNCHTSHILCSECFETAFNIKQSCPLCRSTINMSECIISL
jgi:hypothetical protein